MATWRAKVEDILEKERQEKEQQVLKEQERIRERRKAITEICEALGIERRLTEIGNAFWRSSSIERSFPEAINPELDVRVVSPVYCYYMPGSSHRDNEGDFRETPSRVESTRDALIVSIGLNNYPTVRTGSVTIHVGSLSGQGFGMSVSVDKVTDDTRKQLDEELLKACRSFVGFPEKVGGCGRKIIQVLLSGDFRRENLPSEFEIPPDVLRQLQLKEAEEKAEAQRKANAEQKANPGCLFGIFGF